MALRAHRHMAAASPGMRPRVCGKFIHVGDDKLFVRGVTYGTFRPVDGEEFHDPDVVERDFAQMAGSSVNAVRTYTVPPRWLLDCALRHGLFVMVGLPWEQHVAFLDKRERIRDIVDRVRAGVRTCAGHPAVLCYAIGNEIPSSIVRWYGARRMERFLKRLYMVAKSEDPDGMVTYVNYPSTEFLHLPFVDLVCFNVYLESQDHLNAYLARLQNIAGDRPLLMAEIGLDSRRHGEDVQARVLDWQVRTAFKSGCSGTFVFAWTDEWFRGGFDIEDWDFGITDRSRNPKTALAAVGRAFQDVPFPSERLWPRMSVIVCSHNGARTLEDCCEGLRQLDYPDFEVIVVDDGSTDETAAIARRHGFCVIVTEHRGLSSARNTGFHAATGDIVAYTDDDARSDNHWLMYLAAMFTTSNHVGVGGPNTAPPGDGLVAECVANAPGGPIHILLSDLEAEHLPGCNMAFRKQALEAVGGFDPRFRVAGDDVDLCWRLRERGWTLGFSPSALVWHHRRNSVRAYWRQQCSYGKAEALLEQKWPEKYNAAGHVSWYGRLYGKGWTPPLSSIQRRVYHGRWGSAPFQSVYEVAPGWLGSLPLMPEWYLLIAALAALSALGFLWLPLLFALPLLMLGLGAVLVQAAIGGARATFALPPASRRLELRLKILVAFLHFVQPLARLWGRLHSGLTPWRQRGAGAFVLLGPRAFSTWRAYVLPAEGWLAALERALRDSGAVVRSGGGYDRWDLEVRGGLFGVTRLRMVIEEHGASKQLIRFRVWPKASLLATLTLPGMVLVSLGADIDASPWAAIILACLTFLFLARLYWECDSALATAIAPLEEDGMERDIPFSRSDTVEPITVIAGSSIDTPALDPRTGPRASQAVE